MPRNRFFPSEYDVRSPLMSETAAQVFLGTDGKGITDLIKQRRLSRDPLTGSFARMQVEAVAIEIAKGLGYEPHGTTLGHIEQPLGGISRERQNPNLV